MSNIYVTEPITKGKVVLKTTVGDLDVELWSKESPKACRNFVQLCLEGYYNETIFHRIAKGFIVQGGDPTGTGFGGESIYGGPFTDEFHSRLRFTHRGIVAMASSGPNTNQSQFFITLDKTPELNGTASIFAKITGDTIFNILKFNDYEVDENERPIFPPKIISVDVVWNPFEDIVPREKKKEAEPIAEKPKAKGQKNFSLLSFGDEAEQEEEQAESASTSLKMKSSLMYSEDPTERGTAEEVERHKEKLKEKKGTSNETPSVQLKGEQVSEEEFSKKMRNKNLAKKRKIDKDMFEDDDDQQLQANSAQEDRLKAIREEQKKLKEAILAMKKKDSKKDEPEDKPQTALDEIRAKYLAKKRKSRRPDESQLLEKLEMFQKSLREVPEGVDVNMQPAEEEAEQELKEPKEDEEEEEEDSNFNDPNWKYHLLKFKKEPKVIDPMTRDDLYTTFDPLKFSKVKPLSQHQRRLMTKKNMDEW